MRRVLLAALVFAGSAVQAGVACSAEGAQMTVTPLAARPGDTVKGTAHSYEIPKFTVLP